MAAGANDVAIGPALGSRSPAKWSRRSFIPLSGVVLVLLVILMVARARKPPTIIWASATSISSTASATTHDQCQCPPARQGHGQDMGARMERLTEASLLAPRRELLNLPRSMAPVLRRFFLFFSLVLVVVLNKFLICSMYVVCCMYVVLCCNV